MIGLIYFNNSISIFVGDYRIFCGDLGNDVNDDTLAKSFSRYPSFQKAKVIRDKWTKKTKGYGFVSFKDPHDYMQAMKEMNGQCTCTIIIYRCGTCNYGFMYTCLHLLALPLLWLYFVAKQIL